MNKALTAIDIKKKNNYRSSMKNWISVFSIIGGLSYFIKASSIILSGWQPPLVFEIAPVFFYLTLGLIIRQYVVNPTDKFPVSFVNGIGLFSTLLAVGFFINDSINSDAQLNDGLTSVIQAFSGLIWVFLLIFKTGNMGEDLADFSRFFSEMRIFGITIIPSLILSIILESLNERLLEVSILYIGLGWVYFGMRYVSILKTTK